MDSFICLLLSSVYELAPKVNIFWTAVVDTRIPAQPFDIESYSHT